MTSVWRLFRVELRLFLREPAAVFFALAFPALLAIVIDAAFGHLHVVGRFTVADVNVPAVLAVALANVGLLTVPIVIAEYKERAILKRYRTSPIALSWLLAVLVTVTLLMFAGSAVLVILVTWIGFGLHFGGNPVAFAGLAIVAALAFTALGLMIGGWLRSAR